MRTQTTCIDDRRLRTVLVVLPSFIPPLRTLTLIVFLDTAAMLDSSRELRLGDMPEDIGRMIFESITESDRKTGFSCALVSRKVNLWYVSQFLRYLVNFILNRRVEPFLYRHVVVQRRDQLSHFHRTIHHSRLGKTPHFFSSHVKSLVIVLGSIYTSGSSHLEKILEILEACPNVETLAFSGHLITDRDSWVASQNLLDFIAAPELAPRRLYIGSKLFHDHQRHFSHPIFQNATHLELICQRDFGDSLKEQWDWSTLRYLTNLTHLSVYFEPTWERASYAECVERTISACPQSLRVFVAWLMVGGPVSLRDGLRAIQEGYLDERVVLGYVAWTHVGINTGSHPYTLVRSYEDMDNGTYQWDAAADDCSESEGGESMWALAEDIIEKRRTRKALQV